MPKIGNLISSIHVKGKKYNKPEWWAAKHKIRKNVKKTSLYKANANFNFSYRVNSSRLKGSIWDEFKSNLSVESKKYPDLAPWNPALRPSKQLVIFRKK